jgi:cupin fold WbuC family metalloprotein
MVDLQLRKESDEVYFAAGTRAVAGPKEIAFLKARALANPRRRCRLCLHASLSDPLHDMIIVFHRATYFRPLRHMQRPQAFHIVEGAVRIALLDDNGRLTEVLSLAASSESSPFEVWIPTGQWYAFLLTTEWLVIRETTIGPMMSSEREYAPFAPDDGESTAAAYAAQLREWVNEADQRGA